MKNFNETFMRLMIIYEHFSNGKLYEDYSWYSELCKNDEPVIVIGKKGSYHDALPFVFNEITYLFSEWEKAPFGTIRYNPNPNLDEHDGLQHFLGLSKKEFYHLFIPRMQSTDLGGEELCVHSIPQQVADNILIFLRRELHRREKK